MRFQTCSHCPLLQVSLVIEADTNLVPTGGRFYILAERQDIQKFVADKDSGLIGQVFNGADPLK